MATLLSRYAMPILLLTCCLHSDGWGQEPETLPLPRRDAVDLPGSDELFRIRSEEQARDDIREAAQAKGVKKVEFPVDSQPTPKIDDVPREPLTLTVPLARVCYHPLYYQDIRTERDLRTWGIVEPLRSAFLFYGKTLILPEMMVVVPPCRYRCWDYPFSPYSEWPYGDRHCR